MQYSLQNEIRLLNNNYLTNVFPYLSLCKAISLQEQQLNLMQAKVNLLLQSSEPEESETQLLESYQSTAQEDALLHTKKYLRQCIVHQKQRFDAMYPSAVVNLNEQIESKSCVLDTDLNNMNALCSLESWEIAHHVIESVEVSKLQKFIGMARTYDQMQPGEIGHILEAIKGREN